VPVMNALLSIYSMTWSARSSSDWGMVRPSAFAVFRLITSSNFVGWSVGGSKPCFGLPPQAFPPPTPHGAGLRLGAESVARGWQGGKGVGRVASAGWDSRGAHPAEGLDCVVGATGAEGQVRRTGVPSTGPLSCLRSQTQPGLTSSVISIEYCHHRSLEQR